jgi:hypothetical protein
MAARIREGLAGAATCRGGALGFGAVADGEDSIQGVAWPSSRAPAQQGRGGGHGAGAGVAPASRPPHGASQEDREGRKEIRLVADRRVPHVSETMSGRWAGGFGGLKGAGGLRLGEGKEGFGVV